MMHIVQPTSTTCVQACLAMILGYDIDYVLRDLPHNPRGTTHKKMFEYLVRHSAPIIGTRLTVLRDVSKLPDLAIVRICWPKLPGKPDGHMVIKDGDTWHDPELPEPFKGVLPADRIWTHGGKVTSFLEVARVKERP